MSYNQERKNKSDVYLPQAQVILGKLFTCHPDLIQIAPADLDITQGVDLIAPTNRRVSLRTRYNLSHYGTFGFRNDRDSYLPTEWSKISQPKDPSTASPSLYLYCFVVEGQIKNWWLLNIEAIRKAQRENWECRKSPDYADDAGDGMVIVSGDGFLASDVFVLASSEPPFPTRENICDECRVKDLTAKLQSI